MKIEEKQFARLPMHLQALFTKLPNPCSDAVLAGFPQTSSGVMKAGTVRAAQDQPGSVCYGTFGGNAAESDTYGDKGSAARFFYAAKASRADRNEGVGLGYRLVDDAPEWVIAAVLEAIK